MVEWDHGKPSRRRVGKVTVHLIQTWLTDANLMSPNFLITYDYILSGILHTVIVPCDICYICLPASDLVMHRAIHLVPPVWEGGMAHEGGLDRACQSHGTQKDDKVANLLILSGFLDSPIASHFVSSWHNCHVEYGLVKNFSVSSCNRMNPPPKPSQNLPIHSYDGTP